jgi:hypothetical protein
MIRQGNTVLKRFDSDADLETGEVSAEKRTRKDVTQLVEQRPCRSGYFPSNFGSRFSMKARTPSFMSSDLNSGSSCR